LPGCILGFLGAFLLVFLTPLSAISGYHAMAIIFGIIGVVWLVAALRLKISLINICSVLLINLLLTLFLYGLTSPGAGYNPIEHQSQVDGVKTIEDAVSASRDSQLTGWDLVGICSKPYGEEIQLLPQKPVGHPLPCFREGTWILPAAGISFENYL
jgi:energy-coupling factor transporter transmembrane protein EcfT